MSEAAQEGEKFEIQKIYIKDSSFEVPNGPDIFIVQAQPNPKFEVGFESRLVQGTVYEVLLNVNVSVSVGEQTAFVVEIKQAGVFTVANMPADKTAYMLSGVCPNILFPYARESISELITRGGFQPMYLPLMNFEAIYMQKLQQKGKLNVPKQPVIN